MRWTQERWALVVTAASCFVFAGTMAPMNSFGRLFIALEKDLNLTAVQAGWVGSLAFALNNLASPVASITGGIIGYRYCAVLGSLLSAISVFVSTFTGSYMTFMVCYGILYGVFSNLAIHAPLCVMYKCFTKPLQQSRASGFASAILSIGTATTTIAYEKIVPIFGWRGTLRLSSIYILLCAMPASFLIYPKKFEGSEDIDNKNKEEKKEELHSAMLKPDTTEFGETTEREVSQLPTPVKRQVSFSAGELKSPPENYSGKVSGRDYAKLLKDWRAYVVILAIVFPSMSWAVYWMNIISFFESIGQSSEDILLYVTLITISDLVARIWFCLFRHKLPMKDVYFLSAGEVFYALVTVSFVMFPQRSVLVMCSISVGVGRGFHFMNTYPAVANLLKYHHIDCAVTLALVSLGTGSTIGTLPAGVIFEKTGSYLLAFHLNAVFFLIGAVLLTLLQVHKRCKERNREDSGRRNASNDWISLNSEIVRDR